MFDLTKIELGILRKLDTPIKIQDFLDRLPVNFETGGFTYMSPRRVLREGKAHCFEGALLAALALRLVGEKPLIINLRTVAYDEDHVVALYRRGGYWGAISKTNHATLRFRDPIYRSVRELALSYFHEYFINQTGEKTLRTYSKPLDLSRLKINWMTAEEDLDAVADLLDALPHYDLIPRGNEKWVRRANELERRAGELLEWPDPTLLAKQAKSKLKI